MIMKNIFIFSLLASAVLTLSGADRVVIGDFSADLEKKVLKKKITFPLLEKKQGKIPVLKARIFFETKTPQGWNNTVQLFLNNRKMTARTLFDKERLLRREAMQFKKGKTTRSWYRNSGWLIMYGPGSGEVDSRILNNRQEGYWYYFDISDSVNYKGKPGAKENVLLAGCTLTLSMTGNRNTPMTFKDVQIIYMDSAEADKARKK